MVDTLLKSLVLSYSRRRVFGNREESIIEGRDVFICDANRTEEYSNY